MIDTSALVCALVGDPPAVELRLRLAEDGDLHAPHLIDVEALQVLRRLVAGGLLSSDRAADARADLLDLAITRYPHGGLMERAWELRENLTAYDAVFVALSELLDAPLITGDGRLASAPGHHAVVEVFPVN